MDLVQRSPVKRQDSVAAVIGKGQKIQDSIQFSCWRFVVFTYSNLHGLHRLAPLSSKHNAYHPVITNCQLQRSHTKRLKNGLIIQTTTFVRQAKLHNILAHLTMIQLGHGSVVTRGSTRCLCVFLKVSLIYNSTAKKKHVPTYTLFGNLISANSPLHHDARLPNQDPCCQHSLPQ